MKHVIKNTIIPLLVFIVIFFSGVNSSENKWKLEIKLDKQNYISHEPIWLDITLTNITSDTLRTHGLVSPNCRKFFIELIDEAGKLVEYTGAVNSMVTLPGKLLLNAGEQDYRSFDLLELFASYDKNSGYSVPIMRFPFIPEGTYTVRVLFEDDISNELTFNIVEPAGDEKEALELIEKAGKIWKQNNTDPSSQIYKEIVERFPNSVFAETCFYLSRFYSQERWNGLKDGSYDKRILYKEMLHNYPNSGQSKGWLMAITRDMDDSKKMNFLNKLKETNPNTRSAKFIEQMQRRIGQ